MEMILIVIKLVIVAFVLKDLAAFIGEIILTLVDIVPNRFAKIGLYLVSYLLNCSKCFSFWLSLILSADLFTAALVALVVDIIAQLLTKYNKTLIEL